MMIAVGERVTVDKGFPTEHSGVVAARFKAEPNPGDGMATFYVVDLDMGFFGSDRLTFVSWLVAHQDNVVRA